MVPVAPLSRPPHPLETLGVCLAATVVILFMLTWARGCADRRDFVAACLEGRGTAIYTSSGHRCER